MTSSPRELVSTIVLSFVVTLSSASGMCQTPPDSPTSYGRLFVIPFPNVNLTVSAAFQYQVYVTNPGNVTVGVTMASCDGAPRQDASVGAKGSVVFPFNSSYMMIGEGKIGKCATLTADTDIGVQVLATEKMDGFTSHPVNAWGSDYTVVTHCGFDGELCQVVIVVNQTSQVKIMLPGQGASTPSHVTSPTATNASTLNVTIAPGEVYQLQRKFDITGARITSSVPVGVLSGAANTKVGRSTTPGAFMEHMPPIRSAGTDYIVPLTPGQAGVTDYVRVMALQDSTTVFIWSGEKRFVMKQFEHVTRPLTMPLMLIESDRPIVVVKFSGVTYPTMSVVVPTALFLTGATFVVTRPTYATGLDQYVIVVQSNNSTTCESQLNTVTSNSIPGTDLIAMWYHLTTSGAFNLSCPSSAMAYSYVSSTDFTAQYPIAFSLGSINLPCTPTQGTPGDAIDNDCDGGVDEDDCTTSTPPGNADCAPIISGDRDVYGKSFTFLAPPNASPSQIMLLFASCSPGKDVLITVTTPLDLSLVNMTTKIGAGENHTSLNISNTDVVANGSRIFRDRTVHVAADNEVSVTVVVHTNINIASGISVLVIPDDVLGQEYFIATYRRSSTCNIQITAFHLNTTTVKIRLRLPDPNSSLDFGGQQYHAGQLICVDLEQYQSLQIQAPFDLSGTHITSNKPVSVWSGGISASILSPKYRDSFSEHLPPTVSWGMKFIVRLSDVYLVSNQYDTSCVTNVRGCQDILKIVSSEGNTRVNVSNITLEINNYTLSNPGDYLEIFVGTELLVVTADKPVLVVQILQSYNNSETSAGYVAPVDQYLTSDRIVFPYLPNVTVMLLWATYSLADSDGSILQAGDDPIHMANSTLLSAGGAVYNSPKNFQTVTGNPRFPFGGHVFFSAKSLTMLRPIAFAMNKPNLACNISNSVPGDGIDNDCDGHVDEEECDPNNDPQGADSDDDGMINEDCKIPPMTSSLPTDSPTASYSTPDLDYTASDGLTSATGQATEDLATSFFQDLTTGYSQDSATSYSHDLTTSYSHDSTTGYSHDLYTSYSQDLTTSYSQDVTTGYSQDLTTSYSHDLTTSYSQDLTAGYSQDLTTSYSQDLPASYSHDSTTEFTETQALASITGHTSELASSPPQPSATFVSPGVTLSVWSEMTSSHGTDSLVSKELESVTETFDSVFPSSISHSETESQSTVLLGASSAAPSSFSPSFLGLTPSSTESTSTTTISPSSSTLLSATAPTTAATTGTSLSASASSTTTTTATAVLSSHPCGCLCPSNVLTSRLQSSQIDSLRSSIQKNLEVDKSELSATTRKLISVNDQRPSAQTIGFFGVTLVVVAFSGIVLLDSGILIRNIMKLIQRCKRKK